MQISQFSTFLRCKQLNNRGSKSKIKLIVCITEGIPINDMLRVRSFICEHEPGVLLLGPNCPGLITVF